VGAYSPVIVLEEGIIASKPGYGQHGGLRVQSLQLNYQDTGRGTAGNPEEPGEGKLNERQVDIA
jgi:hypothetical protein